ncbi:acyltransferase family protein [Vibrio coralliirubri]|uniref:acyltransferase family protein n=1 Tax=Vibrio coralliirubri TaxID=1516159 RepID=UPI00069C2B5D|nr:acyltransferase family protein [Vibrio coralliirubri]
MLSYRRELDGLRALAVIAVMTYHANLEVFNLQIFQGGFFGVDVFFVLSGYLITAIIRRDMEKGSFSFLSFYWRRAKRIIPVYFFVLMISLLGAYLFFDIVSWKEFSKSLKSALLFYSNNYFLIQDGYFANNERETLLHTWSLSVEWQFYLIFPLFIFLLSKIAHRYTFSIILASSLLSFVFSYTEIFVFSNYDFAFYSLSTRWWELSTGALITYINRESILEKINNNVLEVIMMTSVFILMFMMFFVDSKAPHPSFHALLVIIATSSYILFANKGELITDVFSLKPIVFLGTISYGMYLWHQPIYVFFRTLKYDQIRNEQFLLLLIITIGLSYFTFKIIETPFRRSLGNKSILASILLLFSLTYIGSNVGKLSPIPSEDISFGGSIAKHENGGNCHGQIENGIYCHFNKKAEYKIITLGDSHLGALLGSLNAYIDNNKKTSWIDLTAGGSYPFHVFWPEDHNDYKRYGIITDNIIEALNEIDLKNTTILYGQYMIGQLDHLNTTDMTKSQKKDKVVSDLQNLQKRVDRLILVYQTPLFPVKSKEMAQKTVNREFNYIQKKILYSELENKMDINKFITSKKESYEVLDRVKGDNVIRIYPENALCDDNYCYAKRKRDGIDVYDDSHASIHGAKKIFRLIEPYLP